MCVGMDGEGPQRPGEMSASWAGLDPAFSPWARWLYNVAEYWGLHPRLISGYRSIREQTELYNRMLNCKASGRTDCLPAAYPGNSLHNYGLAVDIGSDDNARLGALWQSVGGRWGGSFGDPNHFDVG
jgi:hypothetical protein